MNLFKFKLACTLFLLTSEIGLASQETLLPQSPLKTSPSLLNDSAKISDYYGFASKLPGNVEGFYSEYRLYDSWKSLANSNWTKKLLSLNFIQTSPNIQSFFQEWNSPKGLKIREQLQSLLGYEVVIVHPNGFGAEFKNFLDLLCEIELYGFEVAVSEKHPSESEIEIEKEWDHILEEAKAQLRIKGKLFEFPPFMLVSKAIQSKNDLNESINLILEKAEAYFEKTFEKGSFRVAGKYDFHYARTNTTNLFPEQTKTLNEYLGVDNVPDSKITDKTIEFAWGWIEDYLVLSIGKDSSHIQLANTFAESVMNLPEVLSYASQFIDKKPTSFGYTHKALFEKIQFAGQFSKKLTAILKPLRNVLDSKQIQSLVQIFQKFETEINKLSESPSDSQVTVEYYENGWQGKIFGGPRLSLYDSSLPLRFFGLGMPSTFVSLDWHTSKNAKKIKDIIENTVTSLWQWYDTNGRNVVSDEARMPLMLAETMGKPLVKQFWEASRKLESSLGDEKALIIDFNGEMIKSPEIPPAFMDTKLLPRVAYILDIKDREGVSEAWNQLYSSFSPLLLLAPKGMDLAPKSKKEKNTEFYYIPFFDWGNTPQIAISNNLWISSTSPELSLDLTGKRLFPSPTPLALDLKINFDPLWRFGESWLSVLNENKDSIFSKEDAESFKNSYATFKTLLELASVLKNFNLSVSEVNGTRHADFYFKVQDLP